MKIPLEKYMNNIKTTKMLLKMLKLFKLLINILHFLVLKWSMKSKLITANYYNCENYFATCVLLSLYHSANEARFYFKILNSIFIDKKFEILS